MGRGEGRASRSTKPICAQKLTLEEFEGPRYQRIGHIKKLIADGIIDEDAAAHAQGAGRNGRGRVGDAASETGVRGRCGQGRLHLLQAITACCRSSTSGRCRARTGCSTRRILDRQESLVPLRLGYCPECSLVQLLETRPPEEMFGDGLFLLLLLLRGPAEALAATTRWS